MEADELQAILLRNTAALAEVRDRLEGLASRDERATAALSVLRNAIQDTLRRFDRDGYKATDQRLLINALATEALVFDKLGYDLGLPGARFLLGVSEMLRGRNAAALSAFKEFIANASRDDPNLRHAHYLGGMISYNRRDHAQAIEFFRSASLLSPDETKDWQSLVYVAELSFLSRMAPEAIERAFADV